MNWWTGDLNTLSEAEATKLRTENAELRSAIARMRLRIKESEDALHLRNYELAKLGRRIGNMRKKYRDAIKRKQEIIGKYQKVLAGEVVEGE